MTETKKKPNHTLEIGIITLLLYILTRKSKAEPTTIIDITVQEG